MQGNQSFKQLMNNGSDKMSATGSRNLVVAIILAVALIAFEIFNFDTTQFALQSLLGDVEFVGIMWATILAIAFCAIDFAGLVRIFTPEKGFEEPRSVWFLTGAWFLGTIANAVMTWWAVSITLLNHDFGNEVLSREQLLTYVPLFVACLVWLTRILFIGAFSAAGESILGHKTTKPKQMTGNGSGGRATKPYVAPAQPKATQPQPTQQAATRPQPQQAAPRPAPQATPRPQAQPQQAAPRPQPAAPTITYEPVDDPVVQTTPPPPAAAGYSQPQRDGSRIRQRPPMPGAPNRYGTPSGVHAAPTANNQPRRL